MKTNIAMAVLTVCGVLAFSAGCGKNEGVAAQAASDKAAAGASKAIGDVLGGKK